jgi:hypothetical protein
MFETMTAAQIVECMHRTWDASDEDERALWLDSLSDSAARYQDDDSATAVAIRTFYAEITSR